MPPLLLIEMSVTVVFSSIELNLCSCLPQEREPAPCPLVLRPYPELAEHMKRKRERAQCVNFFGKQVLNKRILIDRMPDLSDIDGSDYSRLELECIEPPYRIGVLYSVISHFLCTALCFFNGFCWSDAPHGWSSYLYFGMLAGTIGVRLKGRQGKGFVVDSCLLLLKKMCSPKVFFS